MAESNTPLTFTVRRRSPELIVPSKPTPRELKPLSDIDNQEFLRFQSRSIHFYRGDQKLTSKNPASVIREALGKLLVFYYPFAGRIKEGPAGKLMVDCSGEGVLFIEAEADVTLDEFGDPLHPPFPCWEELIYDVPGSKGILDTPLLLIQVTRLLCGGFIFAVRLNHTMSDAAGIVQFMSGLGEIARGAASPSTLPVWQRELLSLSDQQRMTLTRRESHEVALITPPHNITHKSLFFTTIDISALRRLVPIHLQRCSTFEVLTACIWRCNAISNQPDLDPEQDMPVIWAVNARKLFNPPLPIGYYGNALAFPVAFSIARDLCNKPLGYALELVIKTNSDVKRYIRSVYDIMEMKQGLHFINARSFDVTDVSHIGFDAVEFGWGKPVYGGPVRTPIDIPGLSSFYSPYTNNNGETGIMIPISLPNDVMDRFVKELNNMLAQGNNDEVLLQHKSPTLSKL